jgi:putative hydrolase of HD superfamily
MILYHDYPEIFVGDTDLLDTENRKEKEKKETRTLEQLEKSLPRGVGKDVIQLYTEYKERKTIEAKFVKAIDCLDPMLQSMTSKKEWAEKGYTEENIRAHKEKYLSEFPEMMKLFNQIIEHLLENKIIQEK